MEKYLVAITVALLLCFLLWVLFSDMKRQIDKRTYVERHTGTKFMFRERVDSIVGTGLARGKDMFILVECETSRVRAIPSNLFQEHFEPLSEWRKTHKNS